MPKTHHIHFRGTRKNEKKKPTQNQIRFKIPQKSTFKSLSEPLIKRSISITKIDRDILQKKSWKLTVNVIPREEIKFRAIINRHLLERKFHAAARPQQGQQRQRQRQVGAPHGGRPPPSVSSEVSLHLWMDFRPSGRGRGEGAPTSLHFAKQVYPSLMRKLMKKIRQKWWCMGLCGCLYFCPACSSPVGICVTTLFVHPGSWVSVDSKHTIWSTTTISNPLGPT